MNRNPTTPQTHRGASRFRTSELLHCNITNSRDEDLGDVQDIVLASDHRTIAYVVVAFGGFLGMGNKYFAMPWHQIQVSRMADGDDPRINLAVDQAVLKEAPGFDKDKWPEMADMTWARQVDDFYSTRGFGADRSTMSNRSGSRPVENRSGKSLGRDPDSDTFHFRRVSEMIGLEVVDARREGLAKIEDLILDSGRAQIEGAALSFGGVVGIGKHTTLVPIEALTLDHSGDHYVLPSTKEGLEALALPDGEWPMLDGDDWLTRGRRHFDRVESARSDKNAPATWKA